MHRNLPPRGMLAAALLSLLLGGCLSGGGMPAGLDYRLVNRIDHTPGAVTAPGRRGEQLAMAPDGRMKWIPAPSGWTRASGTWLVPPARTGRTVRNAGRTAVAVPAFAVTEAEAVDGFVLPVSGATFTSGFGMREHPILGGDRLHAGIDLAAPAGTPVRAAVAGTIETAGWNGGYGNYVRIAHGPIGTAYAHLQSYAPGLAPGTAVEAGDIIGYVGTTGRSTGPHLHFEVLVGDDAIDPMSVMPAQIQVALGGAPRIELARGGR